MAYECIPRIIKNEFEIDRQTDSNDQTENDYEPSEPSDQANAESQVMNPRISLITQNSLNLSLDTIIPAYPRPFTEIARK